VDLAVIVFQSAVCHLAMEQCGRKGIKAGVVISASFKEVGGGWNASDSSKRSPTALESRSSAPTAGVSSTPILPVA